MAILAITDLLPFAVIDAAKAQEMIDDATALAVLAAPCLATIEAAPAGETAEALALRMSQLAALKAILRGAILRWNDAGSGAYQSQTAGPFGQQIDTRQPRRGMFWPSEITTLQDICGGTAQGGAFSIDTAGGWSTGHADICSINFGATYCSCGFVLTGSYALWET